MWCSGWGLSSALRGTPDQPDSSCCQHSLRLGVFVCEQLLLPASKGVALFKDTLRAVSAVSGTKYRPSPWTLPTTHYLPTTYPLP